MERAGAAVAGLVLVSVGLSNGVAFAQEPTGSGERVFWTGNTPGDPSLPKRAVLSSLYVLSLGSLAATGYFAYSWLEANEDLSGSRTRGVCFELTSADCRQFTDAQADVRNAQRYTAASAAATTGFLLSGILVAQYWDNAAVRVNVSLNAGSVVLASTF